MTTIISPRKTRSGSTRGSSNTNTHVNNSIPGPSSSSSSSAGSSHSAISKPAFKDRPTASLIPIRPASTRQPFRPTVRQVSNATLTPAASQFQLEGPERKPSIGIKPPTALRETHASRGPSYTLNLKGTALLRQEIQPKPVAAPPSRDAEEESIDESCDEPIEEEEEEEEQQDVEHTAGEPLLEEAILESVASSSSQPVASSSSLGSPPRLSSPFTRRALLSSEDNRPSSSASASTALSDIETDTAASVVSSPDLSDSASEGSSSDRDDEPGEDMTTSTRTTRARSRTPVFFGTPSKDEQEQRRRYSRRVRERRVLRRDSLDLARRKTLTLEEVEDAARAFREEKAAAAAAAHGMPMEGADEATERGDRLDEQEPSPLLTPVRTQQNSIADDHLRQSDELELGQSDELDLQQTDEPKLDQESLSDALIDGACGQQPNVEEEASFEAVVAEHEDPIALVQEAPTALVTLGVEESEAEDVEPEASEVEQAEGSQLGMPSSEMEDCIHLEVSEDAEVSTRQEDEPAVDDQEVQIQDAIMQEETAELTSEEHSVEEAGLSSLPEALKDITNVPHIHKEQDLQIDEAQYEADAPEEDSVGGASEETLPEEAGPLELSAIEEAVTVNSEEHDVDAPSAALTAIDELYVPSSHLYIADVMDQTLAFDRLEEEVGEPLAEKKAEERIPLASQDAQQEPLSTLDSSDLPQPPHQDKLVPEGSGEDSSVADVVDLTSGQGASAEESAIALVLEPLAAMEASGDQVAQPASAAADVVNKDENPISQDDADPTAADVPALTTVDETLAFDVAERLLAEAAPSVDDSIRELIEVRLPEDAEQQEEAPDGVGAALCAENNREEPELLTADQEQLRGEVTETQTSSSPTAMLSPAASPAPATPTANAHDTSSASFMMDSPGVGLSFRRRYDENVLASAAKRAQQSFALGANYGQSPANDSLKSLRASPMPLSLLGTPLGERNSNISYTRRDIELSPFVKEGGKVELNLPQFSAGLESPSRATEEVDHQVSPHMRRMMDIRDAMLIASPTKSPRKPPMRVTVPSPQKAEPISSTIAPLGSPVRKTDASLETSESSELEHKVAGTSVQIAPTCDLAQVFKKPDLSKAEKDASQPPSVSAKTTSSATSASRLPKLASGNSRIAKPTSVGSIRAPTSIPSARAQSAQSSGATSSQLARPSVPSHASAQMSSSNPFQKKAAAKSAAPPNPLSRPPSAADSIGSSNGSLNGPSKEKTLKDPRVAPISAAPTASAASSSGPSPVKRTQPISALRKMQGTSQLSSFTHKTADWLKGSTADANAQWSIGKSVLPSPALARSTVASTVVPEPEGEAGPAAPSSPVKASVVTAGSGRARRVLAGSKEATHAPLEAKAAPIVRPRVLMSSTSSARTDSDLEGGARSDFALSSSPDKTARVHGDSIPPVTERPMMATYRKPSSSSHGAKSLRVASGSSRKASRTGEAAPSSSSAAPHPPSEIFSDTAASPALDTSSAKDDAAVMVKKKDIGHRSISNPLVAAPVRATATNRSASNPPAVGTAPPARASRAKVNDVVPSVPISSAALATLTTRNSRRNEIHLAKLSVVTIRIEGARPPSPSSKIRKSSLAEGAPPMEKGRADEARAVRARKRARESQESRMSASSEAEGRDAERGGVGVWRDPDFRGWETEMAHHRLGAGEEEAYSTPLRVKKRMAGKGVRWRKNLFAGPASSAASSASAPAPWKSNLVAKDYQLDRHGNARSGDAPPSPSWKRVKVTVRKIVYDDDEEEEDCGGETSSAAVDRWGGIEREGAASDGEYGSQL